MTKTTTKPIMNHEMPELLKDLADKTAKILQDRIEIDPDLAAHVGSELARSIAESWGGQTVYVPQALGMFAHERDERIYSEFNGTNHAELARKYQISMQWVYSIVKKMRAIKFKQMQPSLFAEEE